MTPPTNSGIASPPAKPDRPRFYRDGTVVLLIVSLALMILGSLLGRQINTNGGSTSVTEVTIFGTGGYQISAYVYTPPNATPGTPAPAIAMWHGLNNQKDYMDNTALEMARRGFVVVSADMTGHGSSNGPNSANGCGGPDTLSYLLS